MKNLSVHMPSLLVGFGVAALVAVVMGQQVVGSPAVDERQVDAPWAHPSSFVRILGSDPLYIVPEGKWFALTALGTTAPQSASTLLSSNGPAGSSALETTGTILGHYYNGLIANTATVCPPGISFPPGTALDVSGATRSQAWGYLVDTGRQSKPPWVHPKDWVRITNTGPLPYDVPDDRWFVLTALGGTMPDDDATYTRLHANGPGGSDHVDSKGLVLGSYHQGRIAPAAPICPPGISFPGGTQLSVSGPTPSEAWGYLVDA